jgi:hypothetical protein
MTTYVIHTALAGLYLPSESEPFEATTDEAITALLDELDFQLGDDADDDDYGDRAFVESLRGVEGRGDILLKLEQHGECIITLESMHNGFGAYVTLAEVTDDV